MILLVLLLLGHCRDVSTSPGEAEIELVDILAPPLPQENGHFGVRLAAHGGTVVVGVPFESLYVFDRETNGTVEWLKVGACYVYELNLGGDVWSQTSVLRASNAEEWDQFGAEVAVNNGRIAVSATFESSGSATNQSDNSAHFSGAVYVFSKRGGFSLVNKKWVQEAYLKRKAITPLSQFGLEMALGDNFFLGLSKGNLTVGNYTPGLLAVFTRFPGNAPGDAHRWEQTSTAFTREKDTLVDFSFSLFGNKIIIGDSSFRLDGEVDAGVAWIYEFVDGHLRMLQNFTSIIPRLWEGFGRSVSISEDPEGHTMVGISTPGAFFRSKITVYVERQKEYFISLPNINGPMTKDTEPSTVVSGRTVFTAFQEDSTNYSGVNYLEEVHHPGEEVNRSGAVYMHVLGSTWRQAAYIKAPFPEEGDRHVGFAHSEAKFGHTIATTGDYLVACAPFRTAFVNNSGEQWLKKAGECYVYKCSKGCFMYDDVSKRASSGTGRTVLPLWLQLFGALC